MKDEKNIFISLITNFPLPGNTGDRFIVPKEIKTIKEMLVFMNGKADAPLFVSGSQNID